MDFLTRRFMSKRKLREKLVTSRDEFLRPTPRIKSDEHFEGVVTRLHKHRQDGHLSDVDLRIEERIVPAHRAILAAQSEFFDRLFANGASIGSKEELDLTGTVKDHATLVTLLDYMYTGKLEISVKTLHDILPGATAFKLEHAQAHCVQFMIQNMSPIDCLSFWELTEGNNLDRMANICKEVTKCRFIDFIQYRDEVLETSGQFMNRLFEEGVLHPLSTDEILELLLRWMEKRPDTRTSACVGLLQTALVKDRLLQNEIEDFSFLDKDQSRPEDISRGIKARLECLQVSVQKKRMKLDYVEEDMEAILVSCVPTDPRIYHASFQPYRRSETQLHHVDIYVYRPSVNRWFVRSVTVPRGNDITSFVGCSQSYFVFQAYKHKTLIEDEVDTQDIMLYNIVSDEFIHPEDPLIHIYRYLIRSFTNKHVRNSYITTGKRLVAILGNYDKYANLQEWPPQAVMDFDFNSATWVKVGELPKSQRQGMFSWIEHRGDVYVHNGENTKAGIWFKISGFGSGIKITVLEPPPTWFKVEAEGMEIQANGNEIIVGRADKSETEQFVYRISTNTWFTQQKERIQVGRKLLPLSPVWEQRKTVGVHLNVNSFGDGHGGTVTYNLSSPCPYVSHFSSCVPSQPPGPSRSSFRKKDKSKGVVWTEHAAPSGEDIHFLQPSKLSMQALRSLKADGEGYREVSEYRGYSRLHSSRLLTEKEFKTLEKNPPPCESERPYRYFNSDW